MYLEFTKGYQPDPGIQSIRTINYSLLDSEKELFGTAFPEEACYLYELIVFLIPHGVISKNIYVLVTKQDQETLDQSLEEVLEVLVLNLIPDHEELILTTENFRSYESSLGPWKLIPVQHTLNDHTGFVIKRMTRV
jgi:hypothetical protein